VDPKRSLNIWSVGHSNISFEKFLSIVLSQEIEEIVDVRSTPFSRYTPHFNSENLEALLKKSDVSYKFMGDSLGGRPPETELYDSEGHVLYDMLSKNFRFASGLEELCIRSESRRTAMMCSEESPEHCHRRLLIGRVLREQGIDVIHIHGNLKTSRDSELLARWGPHVNETLFGIEEEPWKSIRPVLQNGRQNNSLEY
jgi:uncharacterized protein (DUF488 family)